MTEVVDDTGRLRVSVPASWSDVDLAPGSFDDGSPRPTISAATMLTMFTDGWTAPGLYLAAGPGTVDPSAMLDQRDWDDVCEGDDITTEFSSTALVGQLRTWTDCGGLTTALNVLAARSIDGSYTVYAQVQTLSSGDPTVDAVLQSITALDGQNPGQLSDVIAAPTAEPAPAAWTAGRVPSAAYPTVEDETGRLSMAVAAAYVDHRLAPRLNNDMSSRPWLVAAPSISMYETDWASPGVQAGLLPYTSELYTLLQNVGWADSCDDGGLVSITVREFTGLVQTWSGCGNTSTRLVQAALATDDQSAVVFVEAQLPTADDTDLVMALSSIAISD